MVFHAVKIESLGTCKHGCFGIGSLKAHPMARFVTKPFAVRGLEILTYPYSQK